MRPDPDSFAKAQMDAAEQALDGINDTGRVNFALRLLLGSAIPMRSGA